ncbi:MAG: hypothetical protein HYW38_00145 [Candidatus Colwellbacteria bacterium]|nr:hypothetical protein [Candidatus Colwellbacteria bacterium]
MPRTRVNENQLSLGKHLKAPERQQKADELEEDLVLKEKQLEAVRRAIEAEEYTGNRPGFWDRWKQHCENLRVLRTREAELDSQIRELKEKRKKLGGHPNFRLPVVEGFGLADALRAERKKAERRRK